MGNELITSVSITALLEARSCLKEKVRAAFDRLSEAIALEISVTGKKDSALGHFLTSGREERYSLREPDAALTLALRRVDARFWGILMDQSGIRAFMSAKKQRAFDTLIAEGKTPVFEREAIQSTFAELYEKRADMMEEGLLELFRQLSWDYRTNNPVKLEKKIIVKDVIDTYGSTNNRTMNELDDLVRILSVYDGKTLPEYRHGMHSVVSHALHQRESRVDTEYFTLQIYKKGTGHIRFKDKALPLIDQCNRVIARQFPNALPVPGAQTRGSKH